MQDAAPAELETLTTADGTPLKDSIRKSERRARIRAFLLVLPLLAFLVVTFVVPIIAMMTRSVYNPEVVNYLPRTAEALQQWDREGIPGEEVFAAMAVDMIQGREDRTIGRVAARINRELPGARSLMLGTARDVDEMQAPYKEAFIAEDDRWTDPEFWGILKRESRLITPSYYLLALDYEYTAGKSRRGQRFIRFTRIFLCARPG